MPREVGLWFETKIVFAYAALSYFFRRHLDLGQPSRMHLESFTQASTGQIFLRKYRVLYINLWLIYRRFSDNYLFLFVSLHKTTTDQNVYTTRRDRIHIEICPCGLLNLVENVTKLGVSVRKIRAVNLFNALNYYINYMVRFM